MRNVMATPLAHKKSLNFLFWNIHGQTSKEIGDKFSDNKFLELCKDKDILGFAELHTETSPSIAGFKLIKQKIRKKTHRGPKISGGLAVFAKNEISHLVSFENNNNDDSIWIKIKQGGAELKDVYIGTTYISPLKPNEEKEPIQALFDEAISFYDKGMVFIQGDLNARVGNDPDYISSDKTDDLFGIQNQIVKLPRNAEDRKVCKRGCMLLDLCKSLDFLLANGRKIGDVFGKNTSIQWNGCATVDYLITPTSSFHMINEFRVNDFDPFLSDHCPLLYSIYLDKEISITSDYDSENLFK